MATEATPEEVFDGVMLSDGCLRPMNASAFVSIDLSCIDHIDWLYVVRDALVSLGLPVSLGHPRLNKGVSRGKVYYGCLLSSRSCEYLAEQYKRWYLDGVKRVPVDFELTPATIANWFMGDGSSVWHQYKNRPEHKYIEAKFATHDYTKEDVELLRGTLEQFGVRNPRMYPDRNYYYISVCNEEGAVCLMQTIEPFIVPSYRYRIKYPVHNYRYNVKKEKNYGNRTNTSMRVP